MNNLNLTEKNRKIIDTFVEEIKQAYQNNLVSLILYGSAAKGEFIDANSDFNILVVLNNDSLFNLKKASVIVNKLNYTRVCPIFMNEECIQKSLGVFPMQFLDMKDHYSLLFGKDLLKDANIDTVNLEFQCILELNLKLINLKQQYLKIDQRDKVVLGELLFKNFTSVICILRNLVRLKNNAPLPLTEDILRETAIELQIGITVFLKVLAAKRDPITLTAADIDSLLMEFTNELEKITKRN